MATMITLVVLFFLFHTIHCKSSLYNDKFDESLLVKPLPSGHVYTQFKFVIQRDLENNKIDLNHFRLFPRTLGETLSQYNVRELHLSLTQGLWRHEHWGHPERSAPPGAELWALFGGNISEVSSNWKKLTNVLSGQFCASLNFIDETNTIVPKFSFKPEGAVQKDSYDSHFVRYSNLPHEIVCTENLTPFRKLLPCGAQAGLSTLLNALNIFSANFVSLAVDLQTVCKDTCSNKAIELIHSISIVFDPPVKQLAKQDWSFVKLFGSSLTSTCPVAEKSQVFVDVSANQSGIPFTLNVKPTEVLNQKEIQKNGLSDDVFAFYDLKAIFKDTRHINIGATYISNHIYGIVPSPVFYAERKVTGYGQEQGGIQCTFFNNHPNKPLKILYFDLVPWYLRLYSHTLVVKHGNQVITPDFFHYQPAKDRSRPHHLELVLTLPARSKTELSIEFDFAFLKWTEYPPDANHGFYVGSAVITTLLENGRNCTKFPTEQMLRNEKGIFLRLYTQPLLVSLPTPDFSMPYNVICLTCTVVALAFGPIHNITTKSLHPLEENVESSFLSKLKKRIKTWWSEKEENEEIPKDSEEADSKKLQ